MAGKDIALPATFVLQQGSGQVTYSHIGESIFDRPAVKLILDKVAQSRAPALPDRPR